MSRSVSSLLALLLVFLAACPLPSQGRGGDRLTGTGDGCVLSGRLLDRDGLPMSGLRVLVIHVASGSQRAVFCDEDGAFTIGGLRPGNHRVCRFDEGSEPGTLCVVNVPESGGRRISLEIERTPVARKGKGLLRFFGNQSNNIL